MPDSKSEPLLYTEDQRWFREDYNCRFMTMPKKTVWRLWQLDWIVFIVQGMVQVILRIQFDYLDHIMIFLYNLCFFGGLFYLFHFVRRQTRLGWDDLPSDVYFFLVLFVIQLFNFGLLSNVIFVEIHHFGLDPTDTNMTIGLWLMNSFDFGVIFVFGIWLQITRFGCWHQKVQRNCHAMLVAMYYTIILVLYFEFILYGNKYLNDKFKPLQGARILLCVNFLWLKIRLRETFYSCAKESSGLTKNICENMCGCFRPLEGVQWQKAKNGKLSFYCFNYSMKYFSLIFITFATGQNSLNCDYIGGIFAYICRTWFFVTLLYSVEKLEHSKVEELKQGKEEIMTRFSWEYAFTALRASIDAYYERVIDCNLDTHFSFRVYKRCLYIAFRGTGSFENLKTDLSYGTEPLSILGFSDVDANVHSGFLRAYQAVQEKVLDQVQKYKEEVDIFVVCGHSLGGAMGSLCVLNLAHLYKHDLYFYSFGQPRVGDRVYATLFNELVPNSFRFVVNFDAVPSLPPGFKGYKHHKNEIWIDGEGNMELNMGYYLKSLLPRRNNFSNHSLETSYDSSLKAAAGNQEFHPGYLFDEVSIATQQDFSSSIVAGRNEEYYASSFEMTTK